MFHYFVSPKADSDGNYQAEQHVKMEVEDTNLLSLALTPHPESVQSSGCGAADAESEINKAQAAMQADKNHQTKHKAGVNQLGTYFHTPPTAPAAAVLGVQGVEFKGSTISLTNVVDSLLANSKVEGSSTKVVTAAAVLEDVFQNLEVDEFEALADQCKNHALANEYTQWLRQTGAVEDDYEFMSEEGDPLEDCKDFILWLIDDKLKTSSSQHYVDPAAATAAGKEAASATTTTPSQITADAAKAPLQQETEQETTPATHLAPERDAPATPTQATQQHMDEARSQQTQQVPNQLSTAKPAAVPTVTAAPPDEPAPAAATLKHADGEAAKTGKAKHQLLSQPQNLQQQQQQSQQLQKHLNSKCRKKQFHPFSQSRQMMEQPQVRHSRLFSQQQHQQLSQQLQRQNCSKSR